MSKHILKGLVVCLLAILLTTFAAVPVLAFDARSGDTVTVASGEVVDGDLYVAGSNIIIDGTVNGDIFGVGQTITINGTVNGGVSVAGQTITVNGEIARGARLAGQTVNVSGNINGDLVAAGQTVNVTSTAKIGRDLILATATARIDGHINGNIKGGASEVTLSNGVEGDIELEVDKLTIASTANIQGNLVYTSETEAKIQSGAQVGGVTTHKLPPVKEKPAAGIGLWGKVIGFLMTLVLGIVIVLLAPRRVKAITESIRTRPWPSLGWGAAILIVTPIAALIVCITVIGLPIGLIALALYTIAIYLTQLFVGLLIGQLIIGAFRRVETRAALVGALALGLAILTLLKLIPFVGFFIGLATILFGLGAILVSERKLRAEAQNIS